MNDNEIQFRKHIDELVRGWEEDEKWYAALSGLTSVEELERLSKDDSWTVREQVVGNRSSSVQILSDLSEDEMYPVREAVALNPNTPFKILAILMKDKNKYVRKSAARMMREQRKRKSAGRYRSKRNYIKKIGRYVEGCEPNDR